jgi:predicted ArsR family transcriptional regulator
VDTRQFEATVGDLVAILGDPTRRGIYLAIREAEHPPTASELADAFGIHPNVARHHLDRLVGEGYLEITDPPPGRRAGAGRPPRHYRATGKEVSVAYPPRRYDLLADLLVRVVERLDPDDAARMAEQVGFEFGTDLAGRVGIDGAVDAAGALRAVSGALETIGFGMADEPSDGTLLTRHCPFGQTAADHPEIVCKIDQGIVRGLMEAARGVPGPVVMSPHEEPDEPCVAEV